MAIVHLSAAAPTPHAPPSHRFFCGELRYANVQLSTCIWLLPSACGSSKLIPLHIESCSKAGRAPSGELTVLTFVYTLSHSSPDKWASLIHRLWSFPRLVKRRSTKQTAGGRRIIKCDHVHHRTERSVQTFKNVMPLLRRLQKLQAFTSRWTSEIEKQEEVA